MTTAAPAAALVAQLPGDAGTTVQEALAALGPVTRALAPWVFAGPQAYFSPDIVEWVVPRRFLVAAAPAACLCWVSEEEEAFHALIQEDLPALVAQWQANGLVDDQERLTHDTCSRCGGLLHLALCLLSVRALPTLAEWPLARVVAVPLPANGGEAPWCSGTHTEGSALVMDGVLAAGHVLWLEGTAAHVMIGVSADAGSAVVVQVCAPGGVWDTDGRGRLLASTLPCRVEVLAGAGIGVGVRAPAHGSCAWRLVGGPTPPFVPVAQGARVPDAGALAPIGAPAPSSGALAQGWILGNGLGGAFHAQTAALTAAMPRAADISTGAHVAHAQLLLDHMEAAWHVADERVVFSSNGHVFEHYMKKHATPRPLLTLRLHAYSFSVLPLKPDVIGEQRFRVRVLNMDMTQEPLSPAASAPADEIPCDDGFALADLLTARAPTTAFSLTQSSAGVPLDRIVLAEPQ